MKNIFFLTGLLMCSVTIAATQAKFTITPITPNSNFINISEVGSTSITYQVTNNTSITRTLTTTTLPGISMNTQTTGACSNPFTLAHGQSCLLDLIINGSQLPIKGIKNGPEVCKTNNSGGTTPFLCSQPSPNNQLTIEKVKPILYSTNQNTNSIEKCFINPTTSSLIDCVQFAMSTYVITSSSNIVLNSTNKSLYVIDNGTDKIYKCAVDSVTGNLTACVDSGATGLSGATLQQAIFNANNTYAYVVSNDSGTDDGIVYVCSMNPETGNISACTNSGANYTTLGNNRPVGMTLNKAGNYAYITTYTTTTAASLIYKCVVNSSTGQLSSCINSGATDTFFSTSIALNAAQTFAYITNSSVNENNITVCAINQADGQLTNCYASLAGPFVYPTTIALNSAQTIAYIVNWNGNSISECSVVPSTGDLTNCVDSGATDLAKPEGIALR